jgi:peptidoglycan/LPS O-acetylase OafA/YrhL
VAIPLWTVSIEEQFYLTWPLVFRRLSIRRLALMAVGVLLITNCCRILMAAMGAHVRAIEYSTVTRIDPIILGILIALFTDKIPVLNTGQRISLFAVGVGTWICVSAYSLGYHFEAVHPWRLVIALPLTAVASAAILLAVAGARHPVFKNRLLIYLGKISYGLYVVHMFALSCAARLVHRFSPSILVQASVGLLIAIVLAVASYHCLERPFLKLKERFSYVHSRPL